MQAPDTLLARWATHCSDDLPPCPPAPGLQKELLAHMLFVPLLRQICICENPHCFRTVASQHSLVVWMFTHDAACLRGLDPGVSRKFSCWEGVGLALRTQV